MLKPVMQAVQLFLKGATGRDRHASHQLSEQLLKVQVAYDQLQQQCDQQQQDYNRLQAKHSQLQNECDHLTQNKDKLTQHLHQKKQEHEEFVTFADTDVQFLTEENQDLQSRLQRSESEKVELQNRNGSLLGKVAFLENQLNIRTYQAGAEAATDESQTSDPAKAEPASLSHEISLASIDLTGFSLALVGGHETTYREVSSALRQHGLKRCIHIPPHSIATHNRQQIKDKISNCDLIITITSYVDHSVAKCVKQLKDTQVLAGECIRVSCHGKSGLIREVLNYFTDSLESSEAA